ncbi:hypothetical protein VDG1235_3996 [Verrucomicrobiia bacterium DG1235]|nr:hypothetical protein VDG1235_3996 [Verrucomicrobiae bacterium DG1235]
MAHPVPAIQWDIITAITDQELEYFSSRFSAFFDSGSEKFS